jgi:hypothetical protein
MKIPPVLFTGLSGIGKAMIKSRLDSDDKLLLNGKEKIIKASKKYSITTSYIGKEGEPFSAYFGVILRNKAGQEIDRKIKWLNDFSEQNTVINIVFEAGGVDCVPIYRINTETPITSKCHFLLLPLEKVSIAEVDEKIPENYDDVTKYTSSPRTRELSIDEETIIEKNTVWIFGFPRSGTTWLATQLLSYETKTINEPHIIEHLAFTVGEIENKNIRRIDDMKEIPDYFFSEVYKTTWINYLRKLILNRFYSQIRDLDRKIIVKEPSHLAGFDLISECLPRSRIIILLRDGRDVIDSVLDARSENGFMVKAGYSPILRDKKLEIIEQLSMSWNNVMENLLKVISTHAKELLYVIRYEDLRTNTFEELKKIYQFLNISIDDKKLKKIITMNSFESIPPELKGQGKFARSAEPGLWDKNFNEQEKFLMEEKLGEMLKKLGYKLESQSEMRSLTYQG